MPAAAKDRTTTRRPAAGPRTSAPVKGGRAGGKAAGKAPAAKPAGKPAPKPTGRKAAKRVFTAATADRHELYQLSVQNVESEIDFVDATYLELRGRRAVRLREDFCGTGNTSCEWVRRREGNVALGLDIDQPTLDWGMEHNATALSEEQRRRLTLLNRNVLKPGNATGVDVVLAMNFSYWLFKRREELVGYFRSVRASLGEGGVFFMDHYGGSDAMTEMEETRPIEADKDHGPFTYVWDQASFNPITGDMTCHIHFKFRDKTSIMNAFTYHWRLWSLTEVQDCLREAGFADVLVYWEGDEVDEDGEETGDGDGVFTATREGSADPAFICYVAALK